MRRFEMHRAQDITGVSGTGIVAQGVVFEDGSVAVHWLTPYRSTVVWDSLDDAIAVHGHGGATTFVFLDPDTESDYSHPIGTRP